MFMVCCYRKLINRFNCVIVNIELSKEAGCVDYAGNVCFFILFSVVTPPYTIYMGKDKYES